MDPALLLLQQLGLLAEVSLEKALVRSRRQHRHHEREGLIIDLGQTSAHGLICGKHLTLRVDGARFDCAMPATATPDHERIGVYPTKSHARTGACSPARHEP